MLAIATTTTDCGNGVQFDLRSQRKAISNQRTVLEEAFDCVKHRKTIVGQ